MEEQPKPYTCKHGCERDKLKDMILTQGEGAAKAATYYAARIAELEADLAKAREAISRIEKAYWTEGKDAHWCAAEMRSIASRYFEQGAHHDQPDR